MFPNVKERPFDKEFKFSTSRSSGPGGQNVNKVSSKVELRFSIPQSNYLSEDEKEKLMRLLGKSVTKDGEWIIICQTSRSQITNKQLAIEHFFNTLSSLLKPTKKRKPTQPTKASVAHRLAVKRIKSDKKSNRQFRNFE